jgi:hypothetical protein
MQLEISAHPAMRLPPVCLATLKSNSMRPEAHSEALRNPVSLTRSTLLRRFPSSYNSLVSRCCGTNPIQNA